MAPPPNSSGARIFPDGGSCECGGGPHGRTSGVGDPRGVLARLYQTPRRSSVSLWAADWAAWRQATETWPVAAATPGKGWLSRISLEKRPNPKFTDGCGCAYGAGPSPQAAAPLPKSRGDHATLPGVVAQTNSASKDLARVRPHSHLSQPSHGGGWRRKSFVGRTCRATRPKNLPAGVTQPVTPTYGPTGSVRLQATGSLAAAVRGTLIFPTAETALVGQAARAHMQGSEPPTVRWRGHVLTHRSSSALRGTNPALCTQPGCGRYRTRRAFGAER